tara:strand:+ start:8987 stop:9778 length:792 start_codon:yes stop_codon:yes gene_type:complete
MKRLLLVFSTFILLSSCSKDEIKLTEQRYGYLKFNTNYADVTTSKTPVPECSEETPISIHYKMVNSEGVDYSKTLGIEVFGNKFNIDPFILDEGEYLVTDITLLDSNGEVTHVVPDEVDPRFPFSQLVSKSVPFDISITAGETTNEAIEVICYTEQEFVSFNGELGFDGDASKFISIGIYVGITSVECVSTIGISTFNGRSEVILPIQSDSPMIFPIPAWKSFSIRAYDADGNVVWERLDEPGKEPDFLLTAGEFYYISPNCN